MQEDQVIVWGLSLQIAKKEENGKLWMLLGRKAMKNLNSVKKQRHHFANKGGCSQSYDLSSSHVQMWELDNKEGRVLKNWCFQTVVLEKVLESPLERKEIKPLNLEEKQLWIFFGRTDAEAEAQLVWPPSVKICKWPWCWERLREGEGGNRGWGGWMLSSMQWTWVWASSRRWWRMGKPGMLQSMGWQRTGHNWATEQHTFVSFQ